MINANAVEHCTAAINSFVRFRADTSVHLDAALGADENYALPRLVKAWYLQGGRDAGFAATVSNLVMEAEQSLPSGSGPEHDLLAALKLAQAGRGVESTSKLEEILLTAPTDLFVHTLAHEALFWLGRFDWMRDIAERAAPAWRETDEGYGPFLSLRAFANEEAGCLESAERFGRMAVEIDPTDIWGAHAVAHVLLMKGEVQQGIDWCHDLSQNWGDAGQMRHHMWWHLCLFLLETGEHERILALLTTEIRNPDSVLVQESPAAAIDIQNVASLLFRLELYGVDVGDHWEALATVCAGRVYNHGNAFGNIHDMMVLTATGQSELANELLLSMRAQYEAQSGSVALSYHAAGIPACEAMLAYRNKDYQQVLALLAGVRHNLSLMGASHAQRDVFFHLLFYVAGQEGQYGLQRILLRDIERIGFCAVPQRAAYKAR